MNSRTTRVTRGRCIARRLALGLVAILVGSVPALFATAAATAAPVTAITGVEIMNAPPLMTETPYTVEATWAVDDTAMAGDTFSLDFPDSMSGYAASFALRDDDGAEVGSCVVSSGSFLCTLGDYVETHTNVSGSLHFQARFTSAFDDESVVFTADNGLTFDMATPGGVGDNAASLPQSPEKWGSVNFDGESMTWALNIPAEVLASADGQPVTIADEYDEQLTFDPAATSARWTLDSDWGDDVWHTVSHGTGAGTYSLVADAASHTFTVTFNEPVTSDDRVYQFITVMDFPSGVQDGEAFGNSMTVAGRTVTASPVTYVASGGDGDGDGLGGFDVTKTVSGNGANAVDGAQYTIDYSFIVAGSATTGEFGLTDGTTDGLTDLPVGTVVTLSEAAAAGEDVIYGTPIYTGTGVRDNRDGTATFTITDDTVAIDLENPVSLVPPTDPPSVPDLPVSPGTPGSPGTPNVPAGQDGSLAVTGADATPLILIGAATLLTGALLLIVRRVRRRG
ncbi:Ig-like domain-containing protein [Microbacterium sp. NPDC087592]|uniref:Ig-like domain-containing protein n=1 Tax=Microbacterium sp. NPDC087592 TaxID=3364193 RepID=UPI0038279D39